VLSPVVMFFAPGLIFDVTERFGNRLHVLRSRTRFGRYLVRRVQFSCFMLPDSLWAVPSASGTVVKFCAPGLIFDGTEGIGSRFRILRSRTHFRGYRRR
jgi:hypothetical protein